MDRRHINIFGCGKTAVQFYNRYKKQVQIGYAISNNKKELFFSPEEGVEYKVKRPEAKMGQEDLIIICSNDYDNIAEQLMLLGYQPFKDFIDYQLADILWSEKKIALLYGICHLRGISECLRQSKEFTERYEVFYYANYLISSVYGNMRFQYIITKCDLLIYNFAASPESSRMNEAVLSRLPKKGKTLCLPIIYFGGYFPQSQRMFNEMNPYAIKCDGYNYTPFSYGDSWLNQCIDQGMSVADILDSLYHTDIYDEQFLESYLENEWKRFRFQEQQGEFRFADYIQENFQKRRLFRNEGHMENEILIYYARQVLEKLDVDDTLNIIDEPLMKCSQHLIYPSTAKILGLEWDVMNEILDLYTYNGWKKISVCEFVEKYVEYSSAIRRLKSEKLLP
ncbi:MAG: hypothetical protein HFI75_13255 [Lachnospiraceae bacterium]|nr:hypothetical protein [Lachnospiraceae bacterium]